MGKVVVRGKETRQKALEVVLNGGTIEDAMEQTGYKFDYIRQLCNQNNIEYTRRETANDIRKRETLETVIALYEDGLNSKETAEELNVSLSTIHKYLKKAGLKPKGRTKNILDHDAMREYFAEGHTSKETAEKFGTTSDYASQICRGIRSGNQYTNGLFDREANATKYINERTPNFEYAGNFTGVDGYVDLKCKTCGTIIRKSFVAVRHGTARCDECYRRERERKKAEALKEKEKRLAEKETLQKAKEEERKHKLFSKNAEQAEIAICKCCGAMFFKTGRRTTYCSEECMKKTQNTKGKDKRIRRIKGVVINSDITLEKLYKRDNGVCHICGGVCDWNDYDIREDGTFVANNMYPSIDHIIPITKGGLHSWMNIKLAHRICNTKKGNKISSRSA